jgi:hypothetical protein
MRFASLALVLLVVEASYRRGEAPEGKACHSGTTRFESHALRVAGHSNVLDD